MIALSWNERKQIAESLERWMDKNLAEKGPDWQVEIRGTLAKFQATLGTNGIVTMDLTPGEMEWADEAVTFQRSLVQYAGPEPPIGQFGPALWRGGPAERVHLGPLLRKLWKAQGIVDENTNPELLTDPPFQ